MIHVPVKEEEDTQSYLQLHTNTHNCTRKPSCTLITYTLGVCVWVCRASFRLSWSSNTNIWQRDELSQDAPEHEIKLERWRCGAELKTTPPRGEERRKVSKTRATVRSALLRDSWYISGIRKADELTNKMKTCQWVWTSWVCVGVTVSVFAIVSAVSHPLWL